MLEPPKDLPEVLDDFDIEEEEIAIQNRCVCHPLYCCQGNCFILNTTVAKATAFLLFFTLFFSHFIALNECILYSIHIISNTSTLFKQDYGDRSVSASVCCVHN